MRDRALRDAKDELDARERELTTELEAHTREQTKELEQTRVALTRQEHDLREREEALNLLLRDRVKGIEHLAKAWADWEIARARQEAAYLRHKKHPARTAADLVREKGRDMAELRRRLKVAEYLIALYEWHAPWLPELHEAEIEEAYVASAPDPDEREDPAARFLSVEEYRMLTSAERNQRALDRYLRSHMTPWQLGRDYERYVGYLRELDGYQVTYQGIVRGFDDLGRDLLAERDGLIEVIQCKRWAQHKTIHEKHIFQLYGTMIAARIENPAKRIHGTFVTTTTLSERARAFAQVLEIRVEESFPLADYPRIKCNISRRSGERIYHLPFDQQYDTTLVERDRGELYVATCAEAEDLGFRRAWRWHEPDVSARPS